MFINFGLCGTIHVMRPTCRVVYLTRRTADMLHAMSASQRHVSAALHYISAHLASCQPHHATCWLHRAMCRLHCSMS